MNPETVLYKLIASLSLCDHMGDVADDIDHAMQLLGTDFDFQPGECDHNIEQLKKAGKFNGGIWNELDEEVKP